MAAVNITLNGVICDLYGRTITGPVKIVGELMYSDLGVGGGPVVPPGQPPTSPGVPTHPIMLPGMPGWGDPHPAHPIVIPPPPTEPPQPPDMVKPPPPEGGWGYSPEWGWGYYPGSGDAGPKAAAS